MPDSQTYRMTTPPFLFLSLLAGMAACGILSSDDPPELEPGPRNYSWTVDSVYSAPGGWMNTIWGSSPNDMWIGSSGGSDRLWHYDGEKWEPYSEHIPRSIYTLFGLFQDNIWMGTNGIIYHYNGQEWLPTFTYSPEGMGEPSILDIWGNSALDIYAVGTVPTGQKNPSYKGFILHYNGNQWRELLMTDFGMQFHRIRKNKNGLYLLGSGPYSTQTISDSISFYKYKNENLLELYSDSRRKAGSPGMNLIGNDLYIVVENEMMEVHDMNLNSIMSFNERNVFGVNGRHEKDLFIFSKTAMMHYNGEGTKDLFHLDNQNASLWRGQLFEKDVFFLARDYEAGTNLIYHGTLTKNEQEDE